jgi:hypothetical protein
MKFLAMGFVKRQQQPSPFFDASGNPKAKPYILTSTEREKLRKFCGPTPSEAP